MSSRPMLEGRPEDRQQGDDAVRLRREIAGLEQELQAAKDEATAAKQGAADALAAIRALRDSPLKPLYQALKMIYGEISRVDAASIAAAAAPAAVAVPAASSGTRDPRWESYKTKLGGKLAEMIDTLLDHGEMTRPQLAAVMRRHPDTISAVAGKLAKAGLVKKNGDKYALREL